MKRNELFAYVILICVSAVLLGISIGIGLETIFLFESKSFYFAFIGTIILVGALIAYGNKYKELLKRLE